MKVLLTGSNGFIGKNLLKKFKKLKWYVWEINVDESTNEAPEYAHLENIIEQCDGIFHVGVISDTTLHDCNKMIYVDIMMLRTKCMNLSCKTCKSEHKSNVKLI